MDDAQRVYHMKQVRGRPFVRRTDVADSLQIGQIFVTEFADRKSLGFLVDSEKRFYTLCLLYTSVRAMRSTAFPATDRMCWSKPASR